MSTLASVTAFDTSGVRRRDWTIIGLIGAVHSSSHFFQLILPTLYLSLAHEYGYDFTQLGLLASVFFLVSCFGQASSGFVVDRIGATPVMLVGLSLFVVAAVLMGLSNGYAMLVLAAFIGGTGNAVFHPVDYAIINHRISPQRLGHAFSVHGLTGNLGWALTPVFMAGFIHWFNWRVAVFAAAGLIAIILLCAWLGRHLLAGRGPAWETQAAAASVADATQDKATKGPAALDLSRQSAWDTFRTLLGQPALWGAFLFFACTTIALSAVQNYTIPMLGHVYGIDKVLAGTTLSAYMLAAALGMAAGGFLVGATPNTERTVAISLILAGLLLLVLALGAVPSGFAMTLVALAGFCSGVSAPSRDMLIRRVTPKGATGTVYGLVYSGMDVGSSLAPTGFGILFDLGYVQAPWVGAAVAFCAAAALAVYVAHAASLGASRPVARAAG